MARRNSDNAQDAEDAKRKENDDKNERSENEDESESQQSTDASDDEFEALDSLHDDERYSPEAMSWALDELGDSKYAKYYEIGKERSSEDVQQMANENRKWKIQLRNLQYTNHGEVGHFFLVIHFGWDFKVVSKRVRVKNAVPQHGNQKISKKRQRDNNNSKAKRTWITTGSKGKSIVTQVHLNSDKGETFEFHLDTIQEFLWKGSYFNMFHKKLRIEVWDWYEFLPNKFLAYHEVSLKSIVSGELNYDWELKRQQKGNGRFGEVTIGRLKCQCVVQEILPYQLKLSNWTLNLNPMYKTFKSNNTTDIPGDDIEVSSVQLLPYARFSMLKPSGILKTLGNTATSSRATVIETDSTTYMTTSDLRGMKILHFSGSRLDLEERMLQVEIFNKGWFKNKFFSELIGTTRIPLKSVIQNGHLSAELIPSKSKVSSICGTQNTAAVVTPVPHYQQQPVNSDDGNDNSNKLPFQGTVSQQLGSVAGNLDVECLEASLWREFAQFGELQPPLLRDYAPYNYSYLAVRVLSARNLVGVDTSGYSDPYVTVEWAGTRQSTAVVEESLNPNFDETLYFHVRTSLDPTKVHSQDLIAHPVITITVWDYNAAGASDLLGSAKVYLHEITGCPREYHFPGPKAKRVQIQRKSGSKMDGILGRGRTKPTTILTRVFRADRRLEGLSPGVDSFIKLEAFFRTPEGDLLEPDEASRARSRNQTANSGLGYRSGIMLLPNLKLLEAQQSIMCFCHPQHGSTKITCAMIANRCDMFNLFYSVLAAATEKNGRWSTKSRSRLEVLEKQLGLSNLCAENQYGQEFYLPTFLQPFTPPRAMLDRREIDKMTILSSQKPNSSFAAARMVRAIEFTDIMHDKRNVTRMHQHSWLSPDFFLAMRKGDVKAHSLLLCNMLLGLMTDAYVCIGYTYECTEPGSRSHVGISVAEAEGEPDSDREEESRKVVPYVWVMTRESDSSCCGSLFSDRSKHFGAVKFWDAAKGYYYPPLPNRWKSRDDEDNLKRARGDDYRKGGGRNNKSSQSKKNAIMGEETEDNSSEHETGGVEPELDLDGLEDLSEEDLLDSGLGELGDTFVDIHDVTFSVHNYSNVSFANKPTFESTVTSNRKVNSRVYRNSSPHFGTKQTSTLLESFDAGESTVAKVPTVGANHDIVSRLINGQRHQDAEDYDARFEFQKRKEYIRRYNASVCKKQKNQIGQSREQNPFALLVAVFNHKNLWVNVQEESDPNNMGFDFEDGVDGGWLPVMCPDQSSQSNIRPHYAARNLESMITKEAASDIQVRTLQEVQSGIEAERSVRNLETRWSEQQMGVRITNVLEAKASLERLDKIWENGWNPKTKKWVPMTGVQRNQTVGNDDDGSSFSGYDRFKAYRRSLKLLSSSCPADYKFRMEIVRVNTGDTLEVKRKVLEVGKHRRNDKPRVFEEQHQGREMFAVGVHVERMFHRLTSVYVGVLIVFPSKSAPTTALRMVAPVEPRANTHLLAA